MREAAHDRKPCRRTGKIRRDRRGERRRSRRALRDSTDSMSERARKGSPEMGTVVEDLVRLAWQVDREGRPGTRDALLTLAVCESLEEAPALTEQCRLLLAA